jgi:hypothetical protein
MTKAAVACLVRVVLRACLASGGTVLPGHLAVAEPSCDDTAGRAQAHRYVQQCLEVSPATHPPCNAANPCSLIRDEIRRGCALLGSTAPAFCRTERRPD